jgi:hypothetical protein
MTAKRVKLLLPTAINLLLHINEVIVSGRRKNVTAEIELPSVRTQALTSVYEYSLLRAQED